MLSHDLEYLFKGQTPKIEEYANFVFACSHLSCDQLYSVAIGFPDMHPILKNVVRKHLEEKIQAETQRLRSDALIEKILSRLADHD